MTSSVLSTEHEKGKSLPSIKTPKYRTVKMNNQQQVTNERQLTRLGGNKQILLGEVMMGWRGVRTSQGKKEQRKVHIKYPSGYFFPLLSPLCS